MKKHLVMHLREMKMGIVISYSPYYFCHFFNSSWKHRFDPSLWNDGIHVSDENLADYKPCQTCPWNFIHPVCMENYHNVSYQAGPEQSESSLVSDLKNLVQLLDKVHLLKKP